MSKKNTKTKEFAVVIPDEPKLCYEINRPSSADCAEKCRKLQWFSTANKRMYVYSAFAAVLLAFIVYYVIDGQPLLYGTASVALAFVVYVIFRGHSIFVNGMTGDEAEESHRLDVGFGEEEFAVAFGTDMETMPYASIAEIVVKDNYVYLKLKDSKLFATGIIFRIDSFTEGDPESFVEFVNGKKTAK